LPQKNLSRDFSLQNFILTTQLEMNWRLFSEEGLTGLHPTGLPDGIFSNQKSQFG
jgi:hypothetical protein